MKILCNVSNGFPQNNPSSKNNREVYKAISYSWFLTFLIAGLSSKILSG